MMNTEEKLNEMGKKMPYTVPDNFFADMEKNIRERVAEEPQPAKVVALRPRRKTLEWVLAAAACIAVLVIGCITFYNHQQTDMEDVESAFEQLSPQDQDYLIALSQDDMFLNEQY